MGVPDKQLAEAADYTLWWHTFLQAATFSGIGAAIALGKVLQTREPISFWEAIGRCITTGGIALAAGAALAMVPGLPFIAMIGIAAALASLGNSVLENALYHFLKVKGGR